ncbi:MAG: PRC-barrel domain-containing protein [Anderseniella sp.]|nr:PRC-barrel domain-containing protein [Anderseniella sp.]
MKTLIAAIALSMAIATPVFADNHEMGAVVTEKKGDFFAADFIGKEIYTRETEWDENFFAKDGWETEWENIGQVENIILNQDGSVRAVKLEVGGFLGIGSKHVAVPMSRLSFIRRDGEWDNYFLAVKTNKDELTKMPAYVVLTPAERRKMYDPKM